MDKGLSCCLNYEKMTIVLFLPLQLLKMNLFLSFSDHRYIELFLNSCPKGK